jgi:hypothetical protein
MDGDCGGLRMIAFDCRIGSGNGGWRRTAIAVHGPPDVFGAVKFDRDLTVDRSGDWSILYQPKTLFARGLMSVSELEAYFDSLGR